MDGKLRELEPFHVMCMPKALKLADRNRFLLARSSFDKEALLERRLHTANQHIKEARDHIEKIPHSRPHAPTGLSPAGEQAQKLLNRAASALVSVVTLEAMVLKEELAAAQARIKEAKQNLSKHLPSNESKT